MKSLLLLTAAALAATLFVAAPVGAADLGYGPVYEDDNVYAEVTHRKKKNYYYNSYSDNQYDQNDPNEPNDVYDPAYDAAAGNDEVVDAECVSKRTIRVRLKEQGWKRFHGLAMNADTIGITASRPNGLVYRLKLDRCSGVIMASFLLDQPAHRTASRKYRNYGY